jgi:hypothetical protein
MIYHKLINHQTNTNKYGYLHDSKEQVCHIHSKPKRNSSLHELITNGCLINEKTPNLYDHCQEKFKATQGNYILLHQRLRGRSNVITHVVKVNDNSLTLKADRSNTDPFVFSVSGRVLAYLDPVKIQAEPTNEVLTEYKIPKVVLGLKTLGDIVSGFQNGSIQDGRVRVLKTDMDIIDLIKLLPKPTYTVDL